MRNRRRNPLWRFRRVLFVIGLLGVGSLGAVLYLFSRTTLPPDDYDALKQTTYICTSEVTAPGSCNAENAAASLVPPGEDRIKITYGELPQPLIQAVVATEDQDFFSHRGVDPRGISRAAVQTLLGRRVSQGGSTITQQYVKIAFDDKQRNLTRKMREALRAIKLEQDLTKQCADNAGALNGRTPTQCAKEVILERYLNRAYFGRGASGVQAASHAYFNTDVSQLSVGQSAFLAGLIRNPGAAEPDTHKTEALRRRTVSITRMEEMGFITPEQAKAANDEAFAPRPRQDREGPIAVKGSDVGSDYFVEEVRQQLDDLYNGDYYGKGYRVYTTLNQDLQRAAFESVYAPTDNTLSGLKEMGKTFLDPTKGDPAAAIVSLDENGRVMAMLAGNDFKKSKFNLATSSGGNARQPGSTFKPLDLTTAVENNISLKSLYPALPGEVKIAGGCVDEKKKPWTVSGGGNATTHYRDLVDALTVSANVVFAELVVDLTPEKLQATAKSMGIKAPLEVSNGGGKPFVPCSLALGGLGVPVIDMASAYSTLARGGKQLDPVLIDRIEDVNGNVICVFPVDGHCTRTKLVADRVQADAKTPIRESTAAQVTYAMTQVVAKGTGKRAALPDRPIAGKTGTSQENRDAWFAGFTCGMTTVVWMGHPDAERQMYDFRKPLPASGKIPVDKNGDPVDDPGWHNVEGANFPSYFWNTYMKKVTATKVGDKDVLPPCKTLPHVSQDFTGEQMHPELSTTTLPTCGFDQNTSDTAGDGGNGNGNQQDQGVTCQPANPSDQGSTTSNTRFPFPNSTRPGGPSTFTVPTFTLPTSTTRGQGSTTTTTTRGGGQTSSTTGRGGGQTPNTG